MNKPIAVISPHGDHEENVERIAKVLGRSKLRLDIFKFIYGRGSRPKTVTQILQGLGLSSDKRQRVLNEVNKLRRVVSKETIRPTGGGRSEPAYGKIDDIMAIKAEILRGHAKPEHLKKVPTKRRPQVQITVKSQGASRKQAHPYEKLRVLYLTAAPASQKALRTEAEVRMVQDEVRGSKYRDNLELITKPAADAKSILNGINDHRPQVVHFSGHAGSKSVWLDDGKVVGSVGQPMSFDLLADTLGATNSPPTLLVLNGCDTLDGAGILLSAVKAVVAMSDSITDMGAATFSAQFYAAIASGQPVSEALKQARVVMKAAMLKDAHLPELIHRKDIDPKKLVLIGKRKR